MSLSDHYSKLEVRCRKPLGCGQGIDNQAVCTRELVYLHAHILAQLNPMVIRDSLQTSINNVASFAELAKGCSGRSRSQNDRADVKTSLNMSATVSRSMALLMDTQRGI